MYETKTVNEYLKLANGFERFKHICAHKDLTVDGRTYYNFEPVWKKLREKGIWDIVYDPTFTTFFHGDLCFSNILVGEHPSGAIAIKCIDPRGKFGSLTAYGDCYYDIAKLMHSTDGGYEYFINDRFKVFLSEDYSRIDIEFENDQKNKIDEIFYDEIYSHVDVRKAKFIQGCIFIGMCARHYDSLERQTAMYATGVRLLNEVLQEI